jgi:hypothetical protein
MNPKYPLKKFTIEYNSQSKLFTLRDHDGVLLGEDVNGRELGRDAWRCLGAEAVCYDYDLGLDERMPLIPLYAKYKTRN